MKTVKARRASFVVQVIAKSSLNFALPAVVSLHWEVIHIDYMAIIDMIFCQSISTSIQYTHINNM